MKYNYKCNKTCGHEWNESLPFLSIPDRIICPKCGTKLKVDNEEANIKLELDEVLPPEEEDLEL